MSAKTAKILRIVTLPQLLVFVMILLLRDQYPKGHALAAILTLSIFPLLSYPVCKFVPALAKGGRPTQRKTAVIFAVAAADQNPVFRRERGEKGGVIINGGDVGMHQHITGKVMAQFLRAFQTAFVSGVRVIEHLIVHRAVSLPLISNGRFRRPGNIRLRRQG